MYSHERIRGRSAAADMLALLEIGKGTRLRTTSARDVQGLVRRATTVSTEKNPVVAIFLPRSAPHANQRGSRPTVPWTEDLRGIPQPDLSLGICRDLFLMRSLTNRRAKSRPYHGPRGVGAPRARMLRAGFRLFLRATLRL